MNDPVIEEIHQIRAQLLAQHGGNFAAYFASLIQKQQLHPERYVSFMQATGNSLVDDLNPLALPLA